MSYMEIRNLKKVYNPYGVHPKVALNGLDFDPLPFTQSGRIYEE